MPLLFYIYYLQNKRSTSNLVKRIKNYSSYKTFKMSKTHNLFISHSWNYSDSYIKLLNLLNNRSYFYYKNYSVPKDDPIHTLGSEKELYEAIKRQIAPCGTILMLAGIYSSYSRWINHEIIIASQEFTKKKPIIAIEPWGSERTSKIVKDNADIVVKWNTESIVAAIRKFD